MDIITQKFVVEDKHVNDFNGRTLYSLSRKCETDSGYVFPEFINVPEDVFNAVEVGDEIRLSGYLYRGSDKKVHYGYKALYLGK